MPCLRLYNSSANRREFDRVWERRNFTIALYERAREEARKAEREAPAGVQMSLAFRVKEEEDVEMSKEE
jgi:hypothetical protein